MALNADTLQGVKLALSGFNEGVVLSQITDTTVNGANTYAVFRARVAGNVATSNTEQFQSGNTIVLRALDIGNILGILTDTNLNSLTTVASVRALYTAQDPSLAATYTGYNPQ